MRRITNGWGTRLIDRMHKGTPAMWWTLIAVAAIAVGGVLFFGSSERQKIASNPPPPANSQPEPFSQPPAEPGRAMPR